MGTDHERETMRRDWERDVLARADRHYDDRAVIVSEHDFASMDEAYREADRG